jgi:hypothetical protein
MSVRGTREKVQIAYIGGRPHPPLPMAHTHPGVCIVPLGPNKCVSHGVLRVHFVRRHHPWWPAAVARPSEAAPATFPASFPADPKMCWISYGMVGGTYLGVLGPPVSEILIRPASVKGTCATYPRSDGNRMIPRLGVVGKSLQCCTCSPICCCFMGLPCVGLLPTTFITVAGWRVSPAALLLSRLYDLHNGGRLARKSRGSPIKLVVVGFLQSGRPRDTPGTRPHPSHSNSHSHASDPPRAPAVRHPILVHGTRM